MSIIYTVHGFEFLLDTSDWSSKEGREIAEDVMKARLSELTPEQAAELHAELRKFDDGDSFSLPPLAREISREAFRAGTRGWVCVPDSGHNTEIGAYPDPDGE